MSEDWKKAEKALSYIEVNGNANNDPVTISGQTEGLHCIGIGTDAAVFSYEPEPGYAFKVYSPHAVEKLQAERSVYERLAGSPYHPQYYGYGSNYLVISFERGITLHDCLVHGVPVPEQVIKDVEDAKKLVIARGLNPRDIHLKNVLMQDGRAKVIDVSEYIKEGNDHRWDHLVWAYNNFYGHLEGVKIPSWALATIRKWYNRADQANFSLEEFSQRVSQLFKWTGK
ncbi:serine/threonine protein kinase [Paenibacillus oenotherae]|uniref:Serine/threonine protein kinase n=1 Tax=Paenibacillus oenotherae TaxID=1435645 RepID=A0ABS7DBE9_9BACL|nr:serine/threonine protein kinase [Paenibacillus oenotherae]MBW7476483.1 serine/threonine protein kinase [Paenibacillus oenotherae]